MAALNHLIVHARDKHQSAKFLADLLGVQPGAPWGPFVPVQTANGVTLDFIDSPDDVSSRHFAFLVDDKEFDAAFAKLRQNGIAIYAEPNRTGAGQINHYYGGRGVYFEDPSGHWLELITRPYGDAPP